MTTPQTTDLAAHIQSLAEEIASDKALYVVGVQVRGQKGSRVIEVFLDADEGIDLDELAAVSRDLEFLLDTEDTIKGRYYLNVSSPGADRPLVLPRQYRKHVGRQFRVITGEGEERRERTGALLAVHDGAFELEVDGQTETVAFDDVQEARVQLPW